MLGQRAALGRELRQPLDWQEASLRQAGVQGCRGVALAQDDAIPSRIPWPSWVELGHPEVEGNEDVDAGERRTDVGRPAAMRKPHHMPPDPRRHPREISHGEH
jgi:hypothetical protein